MKETTAVEELQAAVAALRASYDRLRADNATLTAEVARLQMTANPDGAIAPSHDDEEVSRRGLLKHLTGALAAGAGLAAAGAVVGTAPASANHLPGFGHDNSTASRTYVVTSSDSPTFQSENESNGAGISAFSSGGPAVRARSVFSVGIEATSLGSDGIDASVSNGFNAVYGHNEGSGNGVFGEQRAPGSDGNAVLGISKGNGNSVYGYKPPNTPGDAVVGFAQTGRGVLAVSDSGVAIEAAGTGRLRQSLRAAGPPTAGAFFAGEQVRDANGQLWLCVTGNGTNVGTWRRAALVYQGAKGGSVNFLPNPIRLLDTRSGAPLANGATRIVQVTGNVVGGVAVPAGAVGVMGNLTVTQTAAPSGYLTLYPTGSPPGVTTPTSNINWFAASQNLNTAAIVGLNAGGQMTIHNGMAGGSNATHVVFDASAYVF